jgi:hypothetical protein
MKVKCIKCNIHYKDMPLLAAIFVKILELYECRDCREKLSEIRS